MTRTILLVFAIALLGGSALAQDAVARPLITVNGQGEVLVAPDEVAFKLKVRTLDKDLRVAQAKNDQTVKSLLALSRKYEIPPAQVQTDNITLSQRYSSEEVTRKPAVFLGYEVMKRVVIVLRDVSKAEALLGDIFTAGVSEIEDVDFRTTQLRKYKDEARAMAIKAAQEKAVGLTKEIGQTIGKAYSITEEGVSSSLPMNNRSNSFYVEGASSGEGSTIALGQISITARVVVSFELK